MAQCHRLRAKMQRICTKEHAVLAMISHAAVNALLNGTSGILLACGYVAIRNGKIQIHKRFMISAFAVSTVFLFSYLLYHYRVGHVAFQGQAGSARSILFCSLRTRFWPSSSFR